jgi:hypothetical protein
MASPSPLHGPSTTEAVAAQAQSRQGVGRGWRVPSPAPTPAGPDPYTLGEGVTRAERLKPYERKPADPVYRPLQIFTRDPATSLLEGSIALVNVPYEPLAPGPEGALIRVEVEAPVNRLDLEDRAVLIRNGRAPSVSDPLFHQQMVYAVCTSVYAAFRTALGRYVAWGFPDASDDGRPLKLIVQPHAFEGQNAYYEKSRGVLAFGFYRADKLKTVGNNLPGGIFFTCLSHDIVAHEVTHALVDGLRSRFTFPSTVDVLAFHEAFADLIAIFQRFSYGGVVHAAIREAGPDLGRSRLLTNIAEQFGQTTCGASALRTAIDVPEPGTPIRRYGDEAEPHRLGSVLVSAVFEAFVTVFNRKVQPYVRLATNGTGVLPAGQLSADLVDVLARSASRLASQFLSILIRAIDYCPPVDLRFGDFLRALVTADRDLVPDDAYAYREAIVDAFRRRAIFPVNVESLSEDALTWRGPRFPIEPIGDLSFANLRFRGDPQNAASADELVRQARRLGDMICQPRLRKEFGLADGGEAAEVDLPCVESIRSSRRVGPNGQVVFDLVAEVTQRRIVVHEGRTMAFYGGATIILGPDGEVRYVVSKSVASESRLDDQRQFVSTDAGKPFWEATRVGMVPHPQMSKFLHGSPLHP